MLILLISLFSFFSMVPEANAAQGMPAPYVSEGKHVFSTDGFYTLDDDESRDGRLRTRTTLDAGLTDQLGLRMRLVYDGDHTERFSLSRYEFAAKYEFAEQGEWPIDVGIYLGVIGRQDRDDDQLAARLLLAKTLERWSHVGNAVLTRDMGGSWEEAVANVRFRSLYFPHSPAWGFGYEYYGDLGRLENITGFNGNSHAVGPMVTVKPQSWPVSFDAVTLFGVTHETEDVKLLWRIKIPFATPR